MMTADKDKWAKWIIPLAGVLIAANHGNQLFKIAVATIGVSLSSLDVSKVPVDEAQQWAFYYGPISGAIEAVTLIAFGIALVRHSVLACRILVWLLPLILAHDLIYSRLIGARVAEMATFLIIDVSAWVALLIVALSRKRQRAKL